MPKSKAAGLTRRQMLKVGGAATFAGYAVGVEIGRASCRERVYDDV